MTLPDGWLTDGEADALRELGRGKHVLELGAWKGRSTVVLSETAELVVSVDSHKPFTHFGEEFTEDSLPSYLAAVRPLPNVVAIIGTFEAACRALSKDAFEFVFVDGLHDYDNAAADIDVALLFGCRWAIHDYGRWQVAPACSDRGLTPSHTVDSLAVFEKEEE